MVVLESFAELMDYNFQQIKEEMYEQLPKEFPAYMREETTDRPFEKRSYVGSLGVPVKNRDHQPLPFDTFPKGYPSIFVPVTYRLGYMIDRQSIEDEQWGILASRPQGLLRGSVVIKDMTASDILNNGTSAQSYDIGGTPLFSTAQVREDNGGNWSNRIAVDQPITVETLFNAITQLLTLLTDSRGLPITYTGAINLFVPQINAELWEQALVVVNSTMDPNTTDNRINAVIKQFRINVVPLRYLTNPNMWFIAWDKSAPNYGLVLFERVAPTVRPLKPFGDNDDVYYASLRMRFTCGYENSRGIGSVGA